MIYCLNPDCKQPINPEDATVCATCGSPLDAMLRGRYRIQKQLGRGGFGKTFLAVDDDRLKAKCVIKQFSPQIKGTDALEKAVRLFEQEAIRLHELGEHPQIPALLAYFEHDSRLYLVQQFVEGQTLVQELAEQGAFSEQKIREVLVGILPILKFVHDRNIIHRDITPSNIIRRKSDNKLVLIDFGVAKLLNEESFGIPGTKIGTEGYAPIEQLRNGRAYPASDIYSLGTTCLYLLTRTKPEELYDPLRGRWLWREQLKSGGISEGIGRILDTAVKDLVADRYQSAAEAMRELRSALTQPPIGGTSSGAGGAPSLPASGQVVSGQVVSGQVGTPLSVPKTMRPPQTQNPGVSYTAPQTGAPRISGGNQPISRPTGQPIPTSQPKSGQPTSRPVSGQPPVSRPMAPNTGAQPMTGGLSLSAGTENLYSCLASLKGHSSWVLALAISPDSRVLVSGGLDDRIVIWDIATGQPKFVINDAHSKAINSLSISPDGLFAVSGSDDDTIKIWQLATGQLVRTISGHTQDVNAVAVTPDGQFIISGSEDRSVAVWRLATGERLRNFSDVTALVKTTAVSANGEYVASGGSDHAVKVWNLNAGNLVQHLTGHLSAVNAVAISPEGRFVVSGSKDRTVRIWLTKTGEVSKTLVKHLEPVNAVAITPDSRLVISGGGDKTVRLWRLPTGELLATLMQHTGAVNAIAISPNQRWFATAGSDGMIHVWQLTAGGY
jgi:serine/threonine protein kinase